MLRILALVLAITLCGTGLGRAAEAFDPQPWLEDLAQAKQAFQTKYANLEWAEFESAENLTILFEETEQRLAASGSEAEAREAFNRLVRHLGDGHVEIDWPKARRSGAKADQSDLCSDYDPSAVAPPLAAHLPGYSQIETPDSSIFPAGIIRVGARRLGILQIGLFSPHGFPALCRQALEALHLDAHSPCDDACRDRIDDWTGARLTAALASQVEALKRERVAALLVDIAENGGGSEWADAAARMLTPIRLRSGRLGFVRGEHWTRKFADLKDKLRSFAEHAHGADARWLLAMAHQVELRRREAATPCDGAPLWKRKFPNCSWLGRGFYATGLLASADPQTLRGKPWAADVFTPMEFPYREAVWRGPLIVLVDEWTGSASEEFASVLQDNDAALIVGIPTSGSGCGHTDGGTPTRLSHSGAILQLPDCVRFRADGGNQVRGVAPDIMIPFRQHDGATLRAQSLAAKLPEVLEKAAQPPGNTRGS